MDDQYQAWTTDWTLLVVLNSFLGVKVGLLNLFDGKRQQVQKVGF
jgi:hypothetical protein